MQAGWVGWEGRPEAHVPGIPAWPSGPHAVPVAGQPVSGTGQPRAGVGGSGLHQQKLRKQEASGAQPLQEALGPLALLPLLSAQLKGRGFGAKSPAPGSVGASNPLLAHEHGSARPAHSLEVPSERIRAGLGTGHLAAPGPPRAGLEGWPQSVGNRHRAGADSTFCESRATLTEVQWAEEGVTGPCDTRDQPLATSLSELFWPLVSAQAPDPGLYGDKAHPTKTEKPPFSPGSTCRKQRLWVLLVLSSLQRVSFLTR